MKKRLFFVFALSLSSIGVFAQSDMDAYKLSQNDLRGSARAMAMGGAFGALGGDMTGVSINPAGIGSYTQSEIATTLNFANTTTKANFNAGVSEISKFKFNFDNISYVGTLPLTGDVVKSLNFGIAFNRLKNFDRKFEVRGNNQSSVAEYMANRANHLGNNISEDDLMISNGALGKYDWLPVVGLNTWLIEKPGGAWQSSLTNSPTSTYLHMNEKGYVNSYDFNFGFDISEIIGVGVSLAVTDLKYDLYSEYDESLNADNGFTLRNELSTEGAGIQTKVGVIFKPINEFRFGISYHSPTWYNMTDTYNADLFHDLEGVLSNHSESSYEGPTNLNTYDALGKRVAYTDYKLRTPDKWVLSLASVIAQRAIISVDYELTNYDNMLFKDDHGRSSSFDGENQMIKQDFKMSSTLRAGLEVRLTSRASARIGYAWMQSPLKAEFKNAEKGYDAAPAGTVPHYTLAGDVNHFTYGLGYRFTKNFYGDLAFVMKWQEDDVYSFPSVREIDKGTLKTNTVQGLFTLGYKF